MVSALISKQQLHVQVLFGLRGHHGFDGYQWS
jgi:hypothetical protein